MEADKFEHILNERFRDFGSRSPEKVWESVSNQLDSKKRRRGLFWWTFASAAILIIAGASAIWLTANPNGTTGDTSEQPVQNTSTFSEQKTHEQNSKRTTTESKNENKNASVQVQNSQSNQAVTIGKTPPKAVKVKPFREVKMDLEQFQLAEQTAYVGPSLLPVKSPEELPLDLSYNRQPCPAYGLSYPKRSQQFGIQVNTFVKLKNPSYVNYPQLPNTLNDPSINGSTKYISDIHRDIEIEPFYKLVAGRNNSGVRGQILYASTRSSIEINNGYVLNKMNSFGAGIGYDWGIPFNRWDFFVYGTARWEYILGQQYKDWNTSTSTTLNAMVESASKRYHRHAFSMEAGLKTQYNFSYRLTFFGAVGYRNYFYETGVQINDVKNLPHFLSMGIGGAWKFN